MKKLLFLVVICIIGYVLFCTAETGGIEIAATSVHHAETNEVCHDTLLELPKINQSDVIFHYSAMTISYDTNRLIPFWVAYELTASETDGEIPRANGFSMDLNYHGRQAMREDYSNSGWDKGHMAPAADMKWSNKAMYESFYLTNVCPQNHSMNAGPWLRLESWCRNKALKYGAVYLVSGPIVDSNRFGTIGKQKVTVPDKFFKALLASDKGKYLSIAFVMANDTTKQSIPKSCITVDSLEKLTGIDFFVNLPDSIENEVESTFDYKEWIREK